MNLKKPDECLFPWPEKIECFSGQFKADKKTGIKLDGIDKKDLAWFFEEFRLLYNLDLKSGSDGIIAGFDKSIPAEGYRLEILPDKILISASDKRGLFYGMDALLSLGAVQSSCVMFPCCTIEDKPYKTLRGIHIYMPARENIQFVKNLFRYLMKLKLNTVFLEIGAGMEFESHPEINSSWKKFVRRAGNTHIETHRLYQRPFGFKKDAVHPDLAGGSCLSKKEVKDIIITAKKYDIEIIPEVQSLSHSYYLCIAHPEIVERPEDPFPDCYCPSNPESYKLLFDVIDEVVDVFKPGMIHIGHDEWYSIGLCPKCRKRTGAELLISDVVKISNYLKKQNIKTAMWCDKLLNFTGDDGVRYGGIKKEYINEKNGKKEIMRPTYQAISGMPKDILLANWYYSLSQKSDETLHNNGLTFYYGNFSPTKFKNWPERSAPSNVIGGEMSPWTYVSLKKFEQGGHFFNLALGANMLWSHRTKEVSAPIMNKVSAYDPDNDNPQNTITKFSKVHKDISSFLPACRRFFYGLMPSELPNAKQTPIPLKNYLNMQRKGKIGGKNYSIPENVPFDLPRTEKQILGISFDRKEQYTIPIGKSAKSLTIIHALTGDKLTVVNFRFQDITEHVVGVYRIVYHDYTFEEIPVLCRQVIGKWDSGFGADTFAETFPAVGTWTNGKKTAYSYEWINPYPDKIIRTLILESIPLQTEQFFTFGTTPERAGKRRGGLLVFSVALNN